MQNAVNEKHVELQKQAGMDKALANADRYDSRWSEQAFEFLKNFPHKIFKAEDVRRTARAQGFPEPPDDRAWGGIFNKARRAKLIIPKGWVTSSNPVAHGRPVMLWQKVIKDEAQIDMFQRDTAR